MGRDRTVTEETPNDLAAIAALGDPSRRALYDFIVEAGRWVSRDEAAEAVGLERGTATHHLERLADDGLLDVEYRRLSGRRGPGAGRPAKLYRRAQRQFGVSLPPRDYELAGRLLAAAADEARTEHVDIDSALSNVCGAEGRAIGERIRDAMRRSRGRSRKAQLGAVADTLAELGYEPALHDDGTVVLRNCPFHDLAQRHTELVCGMNLCLVSAALEVADTAGVTAVLEPEPGHCCVKLRPR